MKVRWYGTVRPKRRWNRLPKELVTNGIVNGFPEPELKEPTEEMERLVSRMGVVHDARRENSSIRIESDHRRLGYK